eukprot:355524-Chlamydomonas_euryale.AAC.6
MFTPGLENAPEPGMDPDVLDVPSRASADVDIPARPVQIFDVIERLVWRGFAQPHRAAGREQAKARGVACAVSSRKHGPHNSLCGSYIRTNSHPCVRMLQTHEATQAQVSTSLDRADEKMRAAANMFMLSVAASEAHLLDFHIGHSATKAASELE